MYLAKHATSLDQLSDGRLVLGLSSGDRHSDYPMLGIDYDSRGDRYREAWSVFRALPLPRITIPNHHPPMSAPGQKRTTPIAKAGSFFHRIQHSQRQCQLNGPH